MDISKIKALTFDVFGTVVDWRTTMINEGKQLNKEKGIEVDWGKFGDNWRGRYLLITDRIRRGELPWMKLETINRMTLEELLSEYRIYCLSETEKDNLNRVWHRLKPWPDSIPGLKRMRKKYIVAAFSNGDMSLLINMAKKAGIPWDCILSAEIAKRYKVDPETYMMAAEMLGLSTEQIMMVAAHKFDLKAAQAVGMRTAFVPRPLEFGPEPNVPKLLTNTEAKFTEDAEMEDWIDLFADDFKDLARKLAT